MMGRVRVAPQALEVGSHLRGMLVTQFSIFLQGLGDDPFEFRRHVGIQSHRCYWSSVQDRVEDDTRTFPTEGQRPCRHFVQDGTKREQIRAGIQFLASDLFRRHEGDGAKGRTGAGEMLLRVDGHG